MRYRYSVCFTPLASRGAHPARAASTRVARLAAALGSCAMLGRPVFHSGAIITRLWRHLQDAALWRAPQHLCLTSTQGSHAVPTRTRRVPESTRNRHEPPTRLAPAHGPTRGTLRPGPRAPTVTYGSCDNVKSSPTHGRPRDNISVVPLEGGDDSTRERADRTNLFRTTRVGNLNRQTASAATPADGSIRIVRRAAERTGPG